ncbi:MAG: hypothetical protein AB7P22_20770, partial [Vicinamibacterales bacterium]
MSDSVTQARGAAAALLQGEEREPPEGVVRTVALLVRAGVWFQLSRNHDARSCRDAARKRNRLGTTGIPLWDELKTFYGSYSDERGDTRYLLAHTRADRLLDFDKLAASVGATGGVERLADEEFSAGGLEYGLFNPFTSGRLPNDPTPPLPIRQVFDDDVIRPMGVVGTMVTNAGDFTWSVEFRPAEVVRALADTTVAPIDVPDPTAVPRFPGLQLHESIAVITGNGPETGILFWTKLNDAVRRLLGTENTGDTSLPEVVIRSLPEMGLSMELDRRHVEVWAAIEQAVRRACNEGATFIAIPDNTTPFFADRIRALLPAGVEF